MLNKIAYGTDDGGMSFLPYKAALAVKSLNNFSNPKPSDPHHFKEELKTKFQATLAITNRFPNGTVFMEEMLRHYKDDTGKNEPKTIDEYFSMSPTDKAFWENEGNKLLQAMLFLANSKNDPMKRALCLAYSQGNLDCYPLEPDGMTRLYVTQYRIKDKKTSKTGKSEGIDKENENDQVPSEELTETLGAHIDSPSNANGNESDNEENNGNAGKADGTAGVHHVDNDGNIKTKQ